MIEPLGGGPSAPLLSRPPCRWWQRSLGMKCPQPSTVTVSRICRLSIATQPFPSTCELMPPPSPPGMSAQRSRLRWTRDVTSDAVAVKLSLDYSRLEPHEMTQLLALISKATPGRAEENEPLMIEGEVEVGGGAFGTATGR